MEPTDTSSGNLSPLSNRRKDRWGKPGKRMAFAWRSSRIRRAAGLRFPILFRFSVDEFEEGGTTLQESKRAARILRKRCRRLARERGSL
jgi:2,4-dienoyl-CoA reductase-like NADH-dependent reductase (Old Yellow Enzyme family)